MLKKIVYKSEYISLELVEEIRKYIHSIGDSIYESKGPYPTSTSKLGWMGCWDRNLHLEKLDNPIHKLIYKLKQDFGNFTIYCSSVRYLSSPFVPHTDIRSNQALKELKDKGVKEGYVFLIPLWWKENYNPGTAFFNSPANMNEPLYSELPDVLPDYSVEHAETARNLSVREIIKWQNQGDLIAWENYQWHSSCHFGETNYSKEYWVKEFISIETQY